MNRIFVAAAAGAFVFFVLGAAHADSLTVLHAFSGSDGTAPMGLIQAKDGNFYGVGNSGGATDRCKPPDGCGTVFKYGRDGSLSVLHVFAGTDGYEASSVVQGTDGKLYGTARLGGQADANGEGVLFSITTAGKFKVLYRFTGGGDCCDGARPQPRLLVASDGKLYGTTELGGDFRDQDHAGFGTVFRFDPKSNKITYLHSFQLADGNGIFPDGQLIQGADNYLYGTTREGAGNGGSLWKLKTDGSGFQVVAFLPNVEALTGVVQAKDGSFYGTDDIGFGSVYRVDPSGVLTTINKFDRTDGSGLISPVTLGSDGFLYGTGEEGGLLDPQAGDIFRLSTKGKINILHSFLASVPNGILPDTQLIEGTDGLFYGTAALGGSGGRGTLFRIDADDLGPVKSVKAPKTIKSGQSATGTIMLFKPAPNDGLTVTLFAGFGAVTVPSTVVVKAGETKAKFRIDTSKVGSEATFRIYASVNGQGLRTVVTLEP